MIKFLASKLFSKYKVQYKDDLNSYSYYCVIHKYSIDNILKFLETFTYYPLAGLSQNEAAKAVQDKNNLGSTISFKELGCDYCEIYITL